MQNPSLVILAAGMGSRYGGLKQMDGLGPNGETIMDYSVYDAIHAGYKKLIFVIREDFAEVFKKQVSDKFRSSAEVVHVYQTLDTGFDDIETPEERTKPWGTGHAMLAARDVINEPFAVINADDYYGQDAFAQSYQFLTGLEDKALAGMIGYPLVNTLSDHGHVNRGICELEEGMFLKDVVETIGIKKLDDKIVFPVNDNKHQELSSEAIASMNFWLFHPGIFEDISREFRAFLEKNREVPKSEFFIPLFVDALIKDGLMQVLVMSSQDSWLGVTYKEDAAMVRKSMKQLHDSGKYPATLALG